MNSRVNITVLFWKILEERFFHDNLWRNKFHDSFRLSSHFRLRRLVNNNTSPAVKNIASKNSWWRMSPRSKNLPLIRRWWRTINKPTRTKTKPNVPALLLCMFLQSELSEFIYKNSGSKKPYKAIMCTQQKLACAHSFMQRFIFFLLQHKSKKQGAPNWRNLSPNLLKPN